MVRDIRDSSVWVVKMVRASIIILRASCILATGKIMLSMELGSIFIKMESGIPASSKII